MSKPKTKFAQKIVAFAKAMRALKRASKDLNVLVEPAIAKAQTVDDLIKITDLLPKGYRGTRRVPATRFE